MKWEWNIKIVVWNGKEWVKFEYHVEILHPGEDYLVNWEEL